MDEDAYSDDDLGTGPSRPTSAMDNVTRQNLLNVLEEGMVYNFVPCRMAQNLWILSYHVYGRHFYVHVENTLRRLQIPMSMKLSK